MYFFYSKVMRSYKNAQLYVLCFTLKYRPIQHFTVSEQSSGKIAKYVSSSQHKYKNNNSCRGRSPVT